MDRAHRRSPSRLAERDARVDFFRGLALLFIFIDHVKENTLQYVTMQNFGFADAAEVFVALGRICLFSRLHPCLRQAGLVGRARQGGQPRQHALPGAHAVPDRLRGDPHHRYAGVRQSDLRGRSQPGAVLRGACAGVAQGPAAGASAGHARHPAALHRAAALVSGAAPAHAYPSAGGAGCFGGALARRQPARLEPAEPIPRTKAGSSTRSPGSCCSASACSRRSTRASGPCLGLLSG